MTRQEKVLAYLETCSKDCEVKAAKAKPVWNYLLGANIILVATIFMPLAINALWFCIVVGIMIWHQSVHAKYAAAVHKFGGAVEVASLLTSDDPHKLV